MDSPVRSWAGLAVRLIRSVVPLLLVLVLVNEGVSYCNAWLRVYFSWRDAKAAITTVVVDNPKDRIVTARVAQLACQRHGTMLETYDQEVEATTIGLRVSAALHVSHPVEGAVLVPLAMAWQEGRSLTTWRSQPPIVEATLREQFSLMQ